MGEVCAATIHKYNTTLVARFAAHASAQNRREHSTTLQRSIAPLIRHHPASTRTRTQRMGQGTDKAGSKPATKQGQDRSTNCWDSHLGLVFVVVVVVDLLRRALAPARRPRGLRATAAIRARTCDRRPTHQAVSRWMHAGRMMSKQTRGPNWSYTRREARNRQQRPSHKTVL